MQRIRQFTASGLLLVCASQPAWAAQAGNQIAPSAAAVRSPGVVERGGIIDAVDLARKALVIDRISYPLRASPLKVHALVGSAGQQPVQLKAGLRVVFTTAKAYGGAPDQVQEIWIVGSDGQPNKK